MADHTENDQDEISATGDLWKLSVTGGKLWSLRKFVLTNIYLVYYNKKGEKRGQWDISNCIVRPMTPEEAGSKSAMNAFCVTGPRRMYILNANNQYNRGLWMRVIEEQIDEFADPDRRHLRTGEIVYGRAVLKKRGFLGLGSTVRMLLTNYPRIIIIEPTSNAQQQQITWQRDNPPVFGNISEIRFSITYLSKVLRFEDADNGSDYWEEIFKRFPTMTYYVPRRLSTLNIDFNDFDKSADRGDDDDINNMHPEEKEGEVTMSSRQQDKNVRFLLEAKESIDELLTALAHKINESEGASQDSDDISTPVSSSQKHKGRQLRVLRDNVTILSQNVGALLSRFEESGGDMFVDVSALQSVIAETSEMMEVLDADNRRSGANFMAEVDLVDFMVAEAEREAFEVDDMILHAEALELDDSSLDRLAAEFDDIDIPSEVSIEPEAFSAADISIRPRTWIDVRMTRVLVKEFVCRLEGLSESAVFEKRDRSLQAEDELMIQEMQTYGRLVDVESLRGCSLLEASVHVTTFNFDAKDTNARPLGWAAVRLRRVLVKEELQRSLGIDEESLQLGRPARVMEEEKLMLAEVALNGQISLADLSEADEMAITDKTFSAMDSSMRPKGWAALRTRRVLEKEKFLPGSERDHILSRFLRELEEEDIMVAEVVRSGGLGDGSNISPSLFNAADWITINPDVYNSKSELRPAGWLELRQKRVLLKERCLRQLKTPESDLIAEHDRKIKEEESLMVAEVDKYSFVLQVGPSNIQSVPVNVKVQFTPNNVSALDIVISETNFDPSNSTVRPNGWKELRTQRITIKEAAMLKEKLPVRKLKSVLEAEEEALMLREVSLYGCVLPIVSVEASTVELPKPNTQRNSSWLKLRSERVRNKEVARGVDRHTCLARRVEREIDEDAAMTSEANIYGRVLRYTYELPLQEKSSEKPLNWSQLRLRRTIARERVSKDSGVSDSMFSEYLAEEDKLMHAEVAAYGVLLSTEAIGANSIGARDLDINPHTFDPTGSLRPTGWSDLRERRVHEKSSLASNSQVTSAQLHAQRLELEDQLMVADIVNFGHLVDTTGQLNVSSVRYTPERGAAWTQLRSRRVMSKEAIVRDLSCGAEATIKVSQAQKEDDEEKFMIEESSLYRQVFSALPVTRLEVQAKPTEPSGTAADLIITEKTYDPADPIRRPDGWADVRSDRVQAREAAVRTKQMAIQGNLVTEEEDSMQTEVRDYGNSLCLARRANPALLVQSCDLVFNVSTFSATDPIKRPLGWFDLRRARVLAKERINRSLDLPEDQSIEEQEEATMIAEVERYGFVLNKNFDFLSQDITITENNFDSSSVTKRPVLWSALRTKRILMKEHRDRFRGVSEPQIVELRVAREKEEETRMLGEVAKYGALLGVAGSYDGPYRFQNELITSQQSLDPRNLSKRPHGWTVLRTRRVFAIERVARQNGLNDEQISDLRARSLYDVETAMLSEAAMYGCALGVPVKGLEDDRLFHPALLLKMSAANFNPADSTNRPSGWSELRRKRIISKEQFDRFIGVSEETIYEQTSQREIEEEKLMVDEVMQFYSNGTATNRLSRRLSGTWRGSISTKSTKRASSKLPTSSGDVIITPDNFDPKIPSKRPEGWAALRNKRIIMKEQRDRLAGVDEETISAMRDDRELEEEEIMLAEVRQHGQILGIKEVKRPVVAAVVVSADNYSPDDLQKRPSGWRELRTKRVMLKDHIDRLNGVDEASIVEKRKLKEIEEELVMMEEVEQMGRPLAVGEASQPKRESEKVARPINIRNLREKRTIIKEQFDRLDSIDENAFSASISGNVAKTSEKKGEDATKTVALSPRTAHKLILSEPVQELVITPDTFDPTDPSKRPSGWNGVRARRLHRKEQLDRLRGVSEPSILERRLQREVDEESMMINEVSAHGNVVGIGGIDPKRIAQGNRIQYSI